MIKSRWLRPSKFNVDKTIRRIEEAVEYCDEARRNNFYHSPTDCSRALGVEPSIYLQQFPQFYYGVSKGGLPIFYAKAGEIDLKAIGCVTTADAVLQFHWNDMFHQRNATYQKCYKSSGGSFKRYEIIYILDLENLSTAQLNKQLLAMTKSQCKLDELCFPEAMKTMIIVNAPSTFTMVWKLAKTWINPRNAMKVEIYGTNRSQWETRINEIVDKGQLPIEYGGLKDNGTSNDIMRRYMSEQYKSFHQNRDVIDEETHIMSFHHQVSRHQIKVNVGQKISLSVFTNSRTGGTLKINDSRGKLIPCIPPEGIEIIHDVDSKDDGLLVSLSTRPTRYDLDKYGIFLDKPELYTIEISLGAKLQGNFLLVSQTFKDLQCKSNQIEKMKCCSSGDRRVNAISLGVGTISRYDEFVDFQSYEYMYRC